MEKIEDDIYVRRYVDHITDSYLNCIFIKLHFVSSQVMIKNIKDFKQKLIDLFDIYTYVNTHTNLSTRPLEYLNILPMFGIPTEIVYLSFKYYYRLLRYAKYT